VAGRARDSAVGARAGVARGIGITDAGFGKLIAVDQALEVDRLQWSVLLPANRYGAPGADLRSCASSRAGRATGLRAVITGARRRAGAVSRLAAGRRSMTVGRSILGRKRCHLPLLTQSTFNSGHRVSRRPDLPVRRSRRSRHHQHPDGEAFFGDASAIGHRLRVNENQPWMTVVGVAEDVKQSGPTRRGAKWRCTSRSCRPGRSCISPSSFVRPETPRGFAAGEAKGVGARSETADINGVDVADRLSDRLHVRAST
jgi:hypothetical protein